MDYFVKHMRASSTHHDKFKCSFCGYDILVSDTARHLLVHCIGVYECVYCRFGVNDVKSIQNHMCNTHPSKLLCICVRLTRKHQMLTDEEISSVASTMIIHLGQRVDNKIFQKCPFTQKKLNFMSPLIESNLNSADRYKELLSVLGAHKQTTYDTRISNESSNAETSSKSGLELSDIISYKELEKYYMFDDWDKHFATLIPTQLPVTSRRKTFRKPPLVLSAPRTNLFQMQIDIAANHLAKTSGLEGRELYRCSFENCDKQSSDILDFNVHLLQHNQSKDGFKCYHCHVVSQNIAGLKYHIQIHGNHRYFCYFCNYSSAIAKDVQSHIYIKHSRVRVLKIPLNPKKRNSKKDIFVMCTEHHHDMNRFDMSLMEQYEKLCTIDGDNSVSNSAPCLSSEAEKTFATQLDSFAFIPDEQRFVCNALNCRYRNIKENMLKLHLSTLHANEEQYKCPHCDTLICHKMDADKVISHLRLHNSKIYECTNDKFSDHVESNVEKQRDEVNSETLDQALSMTQGDQALSMPQEDQAISITQEDQAISITQEDQALSMTQGDQALSMTQEDQAISMTQENQALSMTQEDQAISITQEDQALSLTQGDQALSMTQEDQAISMTQENQALSMTQEDQAISITQEDQAISITQEDQALSMTQEDQALSMTQEDQAISMTQENQALSITQEYQAISITQEDQPISITHEDQAISITHEDQAISITHEDQAISITQDKRTLALDDRAKPKWQCKLCNDVYSTQKLIEVHIQTVHGKKFQYQCGICLEILSTTIAYIQDHINLRHPNELSRIKAYYKKIQCVDDNREGNNNALRPHDNTDKIEPSGVTHSKDENFNTTGTTGNCLTLHSNRANKSLNVDHLDLSNVLDINEREKNCRDSSSRVSDENIAKELLTPSVNLSTSKDSIVASSTKPPITNRSAKRLLHVPTVNSDVSSVGSKVKFPGSIFYACYHCNFRALNPTATFKHWKENHKFRKFSIGILKTIESADFSFMFKCLKIFECYYCRKRCYENLKGHNEKYHPQETFAMVDNANPKKCGFCVHQFNNVDAEIINHFKQFHKNITNEPDNYLTDELLDEMIAVRPRESYNCNYCIEDFISMTQLYVHVKEKHPRIEKVFDYASNDSVVYGCPNCPKVDSNESSMVKHIRNHFLQFQCKFCEKRFSRIEMVQLHHEMMHNCTDKTYRNIDVTENVDKYLGMKIIFANGLVLTKGEAKHTRYGAMDSVMKLVTEMNQNDLKLVRKRYREQENSTSDSGDSYSTADVEFSLPSKVHLKKRRKLNTDNIIQTSHIYTDKENNFATAL